MPARRTHLAPETAHGALAAALEALRDKNDVVDEFPPDVVAEAERVPAPRPDLDLRDVPFVTLDPAESRDLDQAFHIERTESGFTLRYAIADVPGVVAPGGALDAEARRRGQTLYLPDGSVPLHPRVLSEDRASLLPGVDRSAYVWTIPVDASGAAAFEGGAAAPAHVERALIRSREKLAYATAQVTLDAGEATGALALLPEFAQLRITQERERGGASLNMADEEVVRDDGGYRIVRRFPLPVEEWNSQLSLLTGMFAGRLMLDAGVGILRTMPAPDAKGLAEFHGRVQALGVPWRDGISYGEYLREVPRDTPQGAAILHAASSLFRGADYVAFGAGASGGSDAVPKQPEQAAIAAPYAHVTAPLRRLVDRWGLVICEALSAGEPIPAWALASLAEVPALMRSSTGLAGRLGSAALDRVEAALVRDRAGEVFPAVVIEAQGASARVQITDPPITTRCPDPEAVLVAGTVTQVRVRRADVAKGDVELELAPQAAG
ncbi:RNB domain-containing ribonuclease [Leucobacter albus]|uniref:RNB domain-containing ribonuclease n=1 Tax=Leucobacter albus TaxID=272210 RepID=A0ABW3TT58_9MICO